MAAPRKLADTFIAEHKKAAKGKRIETSDLGTHLRLRVTDKLKSFYWCGRLPGAASSARLHLGNYPAMTLAEARKKVIEWDSLIEQGIDPRVELERKREANAAAQRAEEQAGENVFELRAREYLRTHCAKHRQASETIRIIDVELVPAWKGRRFDEITSRDIKRLVLAVAERSPSMSRNVLTVIKSLWAWAFEREYVADNPAAAIRPKTLIGEKKPRTRVLSDSEIGAFWKATEQLTAPYRQLFRFLLITGTRLREAAHAKWPEFDLDARLWHIPAERFKSDAVHTVALSDMAMSVLDELPRDGEHVFSCDGGKHPIDSFSKAKARIDQLMGVADWRTHDLRRVVRSKLASLKVPDNIAELLIGHGKRGLARVYDQHAYLDELIEAHRAWSGRLRDIITPPPSNVKKFERKRKLAS